MTTIDTNKIQELLDSDVSAYSIEAVTGLNRTTISQLRTKKKNIMTLTMQNALKLQKFWEEHKMTTKKEKIAEYLENYSKTMSTSMDEIFDLFKTDVRELSQEYKKGEAYVYTVKELREECEENDNQEKMSMLEGHDDDEIVVDTINGYMYFVG